MFDDFLRKTFVRHDDGVDTVIYGRFARSDNIRRYVFPEAASGLYHRPATNARSLTHQNVTTEDYTILDYAIT